METVEQSALIARARAGDAASFAELAGRYRAMAFGYALATLRDYHLAQDVTQEAFASAYFSLPRLQNPAAFPAWLRGIVRHHCCRIVRRRRLDVVPLEEGLGLPSPAPGPEQRAVDREGFYRVLGAMATLPEAQREVAALYYVRDYSQHEIAAFLDVPVTTVNNRLHAARTRLRERLRIMSSKMGTVTAVHGPLVDVRFEPEDAPMILAALQPADGDEVALQVVQRLGGGLVRCLATSGAAPTPGTGIVDSGNPATTVMDTQTLDRVMPLLGNGEGSAAVRPQVLETGIKVIDLLCPCVEGGKVGFFGPSGCGRMVVSTEVLHNIASRAADLVLCAFLHGEAEAIGLYGSTEDVPFSSGMVCVPIDDAVDLASHASLAASRYLDTVVYLSRNVAGSGIYPAVDPLRSRSRALDPGIVGREHCDVACGVRAVLRRHEEIAESVLALPDGGDALSEKDQVLVARARKIRRFCSQPFFVAEPFTGRPGQYVSRQETVRAFKGLLAGEYDHIPEEAFLWCGTIDQAVEKGAAATHL